MAPPAAARAPATIAYEREATLQKDRAEAQRSHRRDRLGQLAPLDLEQPRVLCLERHFTGHLPLVSAVWAQAKPRLQRNTVEKSYTIAFA